MTRRGISETKRAIQAAVPWRVYMLLVTDADRCGETLAACVRRHLERSLALGIAPERGRQ